MNKDSPILTRIFKEEAELEESGSGLATANCAVEDLSICRWSGDLGPKKKQGDRQAPEGFYTITPGQMNRIQLLPCLQYWLSERL